MWKENLSLLLQRKGERREKGPWHESIRSWWKGIPEICMDEIMLNPKSLQISCLILTYSSQGNCSRWGGQRVCVPLWFRSLCMKIKMNHPSDSSLWIFCSLASKQKLLKSVLLRCASADNQYLIKAKSTRSQTNLLPFFFPGAFLYL